MKMNKIIDPVPVADLLSELTQERFFRKTNNAGNELYIVNAHNSPAIMREIGRLREISFRDSGGGTGLDCDIDVFDTREENFFEQLIPTTRPSWVATAFCFATAFPWTKTVKLIRPPASFSTIPKGS